MPVLQQKYRRDGIVRPGKGRQVPDQITKFTDLSDVPSSYVGESGKAVKVKSDEEELEFV